MRINHNISAMGTYNQLSTNENEQAKSMEKLSTGKRINRGADDAAGLAISERMKAQIRGLDQASRNSQDAVSAIQVADGALGQATDILQRMKELATQAASDTNSSSDRTAISGEITSLTSGLRDIVTNTTFNGQKLLSDASGLTAQVQTGSEAGQNLTVDFKTNAGLSGIIDTMSGAGIAVDTAANASTAITSIEDAINSVSNSRAYLGAQQDRLEHTITNLDTASQNTQSAQSRIEDVDMAKAVMENSKNGILVQAGQAMLGQANQMPQGVLQLLRG